MKWTEEQLAAIEMRGKNMLVSAAAGSGKTAVLVERIKRLILEDGVELTQMLIVTFSSAAASEMREKIVSAINDSLEQPELPPEQERFLRRQLNSMHKANISTFHAFSMEVIRRYFHLIHLEPNFKICDDAQKTILQTEAMEELFTERFAESSPEFLEFLRRYAGSKNENAVKELIRSTHEFIQSIPDPRGWLDAHVEQLSAGVEEFLRGPAFREMTQRIRGDLRLVLRYLEQTEELLTHGGVESLIPKNAVDMGMIEGLLQSFDADEREKTSGTEWFDGLSRAMKAGKFQTFRASKEENEAYGEIREPVKQLRDRAKAIFKKLTELYLAKPLSSYVGEIRQTAEPARYLEGLVWDFDRRYRLKKEKKRVLDFNDIEHYALAVLEHEEAAEEYRRRFHYIFIDEYQDSNVVQETLIDRIKRDDNLFMVGDVKQSIYKFRLAEPELFIGKYEAFRSGVRPQDRKLDLNRNFRSKGNVVRGVNDVFSRIMTKETTGMDYDGAAALYQGVAYEGPLDYPLELHLADDRQLTGEDLEGGGPDEEIRELKKAEVEAAVAAQLVRQAIGKPIYDGKKNVERPLRKRDMVILLRGAKNYADLYYTALTDAGIPAFVDAGDGYFDTLEIQVFLNVLRVIDNKKQDVPLLSALRSPVFGFTIPELAEIRAAHRRGSYYEALAAASAAGGVSVTEGNADASLEIEPESVRKPASELAAKCADTLARLARWKEQASYLPLAEFIRMLLRDTGYSLYVGALPGGTQRQANLRALVDKAVAFQNAQMKGLFGFIRYIEALQEGKVSMGQVRLISENDDVVRIMTVHKSKGLEFPYVLVGGLGKRFNRDGGGAKAGMHKELGLALRLVEPEDHCYKKTLLQTIIEQKKAAEDMAEEIRILYVAFTRAMDQMVLLGTVTNAGEQLEQLEYRQEEDVFGAKSYLELILPALLAAGVDLRIHDRGQLQAAKREADEDLLLLQKGLAGGFAEGPEDAAPELVRREVERRLGFSYEYEKALGMKSKYSVSELARGDVTERPLAGRVVVGEVDAAEAAWNADRGEITDFRQKASVAAPRFTMKKKSFTGAEKGTILHKIMEHIPFDAERFGSGEQDSGQNAERAIEDFVTDMTARLLLTEEEAGAADLRKIAGFFRSEIGKRACRAELVRKEVSFNLKKQMEGETVIVQGTIDCFFRERLADGTRRTVLLDYKSNYVPKDEVGEPDTDRLLERYRPQVMMYREALEKIKGIRVDESYLYLFGIGRAIRVV